MYDVPEVVRISSDSLFQGSFQSYPTGENAQNAFRADAGLPSRYFAVTGTDNAVALALDRSFVRGNQYALYCFTHSAYAARLADYHDMLNESALLRGVEDLPQQFDGNNDNVLVVYKEFLQRFGTHAIVSVNYGARFQLVGVVFVWKTYVSNPSLVEWVGIQREYVCQRQVRHGREGLLQRHPQWRGVRPICQVRGAVQALSRILSADRNGRWRRFRPCCCRHVRPDELEHIRKVVCHRIRGKTDAYKFPHDGYMDTYVGIPF